jgi:acetyl esterase/lipase
MTDNKSTVDQITRQVAALGAKFDPEVLAATRAVYVPHLDLSTAAGEQTDLGYGSHPRHRLDVYRPHGPPKAIVVFFHGGGFVAGDKNGDGVFYRNLGRWLARQGFTAVLPNYRLAPECTWPAGALDVQAVLQWVSQNRDAVLGGAAPVVLWGQSAGASHVATWLFDDAARATAAAPVNAVMLMSGFYSAEPPLGPGPLAYFGEDTAQYAQRSPLSHVHALGVPLWLSLAELDPAWIAHQTYALARVLTLASGRSPDFHFFRGHNHVSTVQSLGSPQSDVGTEILRFLATNLDKAA